MSESGHEQVTAPVKAAGPGRERRGYRRWTLGLLLLIVAVFVVPRLWLVWQLRTARLALAAGNHQRAIDALKLSGAIFPNSAEVQYRLAVAHRKAGQLEEVIQPLQSAEKLGWKKEDIERQSLLTIAQSGQIDLVDPQLKMIMARGASDEAAEEIYEALAIGYLKSYRLKDAWECLTFWGEWQPKAIFPRLWRAEICRRIDNGAGEEREYREILAIDPSHLEARSRLADVLKKSNRIEEAAAEYEKCVQGAPGKVNVLIGLAECRRRLGDTQAALSLLDRAMVLSPTDFERSMALTHRGQIEGDAGNWQASIKLLEEAVRLMPSEPGPLFALSQAYASTGDQERSEELLEQSKQVRTKLLRVEEISQSLLKKPGSADLRYEAGKILMDLGLKEEGAAWLRTALQFRPDHAGAREALDQYVGPAGR